MEVSTNSFTVNYASRRGEVWRWYWRAWAKPAGFWRVHVLFGVTCALVFTVLRNPKSFDVGLFLVAAAVYTLTFVILLPLWPQIRFKSAVRSLTINAQGLTTSIGKILASRLWSDVRSIDEKDNTIVIVGRNKNAFIVPARAFAGESERREFYEAAHRWWAQASET
jgi:YcxB-like protein